MRIILFGMLWRTQLTTWINLVMIMKVTQCCCMAASRSAALLKRHREFASVPFPKKLPRKPAAKPLGDEDFLNEFVQNLTDEEGDEEDSEGIVGGEYEDSC